MFQQWRLIGLHPIKPCTHVLDLKDIAMTKKHTSIDNPIDSQAAHTGKVANDHNKVGEQALTSKNEGKRTPISRGDRNASLGSDNQSRERRGKVGHVSH